MLTNLEKGDVVAIRNATGETRSVTVLSVKQDYDQPGAFLRFDYIDHAEPSPMRRTAYPKELVQILKKTTIPKLDPKAPRPGDSQTPQKAVIIDGRTYVERSSQGQGSVESVLVPSAGPQVHKAVKAPPKPVQERIKKAPVAAK
jgi:hypothetical protein